MSVIALHHVQLAMPEGREDDAEAFYQGLLGMERIPKPEPLAARGGCWFKSGEVELHLGVEQEFRPARKAHPALEVDDLEGLRDLLRSEGIEIVEDDLLEGYDRFYVSDPFGNRIEVLRPRR